MNLPVSDTILALPRVWKRVIALVTDLCVVMVTVAGAFYLRLGEWVFPEGGQWLAYGAAVIFAVPLFVSFGLYRAIFRYAGWAAAMAVLRACAIYGILYASIFTIMGVVGVPRTIGLIQPILLLMSVGAARAFARVMLGGSLEAAMRGGNRERALIFGAGSAGRQLANALTGSAEIEFVGFVDDDPTLQGSVLNGKQIYPAIDLPRLFEKLGITRMLLAMPSVSRRRRNEILELARGTHVAIQTLPGLMDIAQGRVTVNDLRELDIEDLLGRDTVAPNQILLSKNLADKTVMVTGAGGSIGSELCRQIFHLRPRKLLLVDSSEYALYAIHTELSVYQENGQDPSVDVLPLLASVQDSNRMRRLMGTWKPDTVYHAAAYKHVPLVEHNPCEGVRNNVFGTLITAQAAVEHGVGDFVLVSTDKAVRPTNVMGTSKRLAEMVLQALADRKPATRFSMVRFGNVLGSSGSVVPLFRRQIREGGPITITHEDITRYFMTIPEAAELVIQAGAMATGGEVYVLDMGDPVRIKDLARRMIELSGLTVRSDNNPEGDIEISVVGLRPGEKLYEELLIGEDAKPTQHSRIMKARDSFLAWERLGPTLDALLAEIERGNAAIVRDMLNHLVPEFTPDDEVVDWVHLHNRDRRKNWR